MNNTYRTSVAGNGSTELVGRSSVNTALVFLVVTGISGIFIETLIFLMLGAGIALMASTLSFVLIFGALFRNFWRTTATAYTRGEMVIVKYLNGHVRITELKHLKIGKTHRYLLFNVSGMKFRLDGRQHRVLFFSSQFIHSGQPTSLQKAA